MSRKRFTGRDVAPFLQGVRNFLLGRRHKLLAVRFTNLIAARTQKHPRIADGPSTGISNNSYCERDARRLVKGPIDITKQKALPKPGEKATFKLPSPGKYHRWD